VDRSVAAPHHQVMDEAARDETADDVVEAERPDGPLGEAHVPERLPRLAAARRGAVQPWRQRAGALRTSLPELARNPVVVSASTVAVTLAARLAVEVARRALAGGAAPAAGRLQVSGEVVHHVVHHHVVHHTHVVHHLVTPVVRLPLPPLPRR